MIYGRCIGKRMTWGYVGSRRRMIQGIGRRIPQECVGEMPEDKADMEEIEGDVWKGG